MSAMPRTIVNAPRASDASPRPSSAMFPDPAANIDGRHYDAVLVGGGIMSATLATLLSLVEPEWRIAVVERLDDVALESSNPWNNAGTGHSALCELNYTPEAADGSIDITKAITINEQFQISRQLWASLVREGHVSDPTSFLAITAHMTLVHGTANVDYLRRRYQALKDHPLFATMEFSDNPDVIAQWAPLLMRARSDGQPLAATRVAEGTDVNFGALTRKLLGFATARGGQLHLNSEVTKLRRTDNGWKLQVRDRSWNTRRRHQSITARFVFVGAGGYALPLLQKAGIPEIRGYGGFPISGQFLRTDNPELVAQHQAKVYGKADVGSPPMSVPHLDTRVVDGKESLLFGPYAGFSPRFLKTGSITDLAASLRPGNIGSMLGAGWRNLDLTKYLVGQLLARPETKFRALQAFMPSARPADWHTMTAGQRVQVIKRDASGAGKLEFGTELVCSADGSIAGLLGASPGASTAASAMIGLLERCFPAEYPGWRPELERLVPQLAE